MWTIEQQQKDSWIVIKDSFLPAINRSKLSSIDLVDDKIEFTFDNGQKKYWTGNVKTIHQWYKDLLKLLLNE